MKKSSTKSSRVCIQCGSTFERYIPPCKADDRLYARFCDKSCAASYSNAHRESTAVPVEKRFQKYVANHPTKTGCILWLGYSLPSGYGLIQNKPTDKRMTFVHRLVWELKNGPIPKRNDYLS